MKKIYLLIVLLLFNISFWQKTYAQNTFISSIDRQSGSLNEIVTINGNGFDSDPNNLRVFFGGALATIVTATPTLLEVQIPANASFDHISVINLTNDTHVTSGERFFLSYNGDGFDLANLSSQSMNPTGQSGVFDVCLCDFNLDGTSDMAVTNLNLVSIFTNNSTVGNINLTQTDFVIDDVSSSDCGDLNGDGLPDLILAEGGTQRFRIYIFENTTTGSAITFNTPPQILELPRLPGDIIQNIERILMQDIDKDGRQDIIATSTIEDSGITIFQNISTDGNIIFNDTPIVLFIDEGLGTSSLDSHDLNNDGFDEIIVTPNQRPNIYIFPNNSNVGEIKFDGFIRLDQTGNLASIKAGDLNNDGFADLVTVDGGTPGGNDVTNNANIFINNTGTAGSNISFTKDSDIAVNANPAEINFGDLNGDGLLDVITSSLITNTETSPLRIPGITALINQSTGGNLTFNSIDIPTVNSTRNIEINDIDSDGRPDIVFTHIVTESIAGDLSIFLNQNCIIPEISPAANQLICADNDLQLQATQSNGSTYRWDLNINNGGFATVQESALSTINPQNFLTAGQTGIFRVTLISNGGACQNASNEVRVITDLETATAPIVSANQTEVCPGDPLIVSSNIPSDGTVVYQWVLPNDSLASSEVINIPSFEPRFAGRYELTINNGRCTSSAGFVIIGARNTPFILIDTGESNLICGNDPLELSVPEFTGFSYQWMFEGIDLNGETNTTLSTARPGEYNLRITDEVNNCPFETPSVTLRQIVPPVASFTSDQLICEDLPLEFTATSTGDSEFLLSHAWDFMDGNSATGPNATNTFSDGGQFNVSLTSEYIGLPGCNNTASNTITIRELGLTVDVTAPNGLLKCPSEELRLELPENFRSFNWSTGDTEMDFFTSAGTTPGESSNTVTVDYVDDAGCVGDTEVTISNHPNSELIIESTSIIEDDTIRLGENEQSIDLFVALGIDPIWEPAEVIENNNTTNVTVFPSRAFTTVSLTATTSNDCRETKSVVIQNNFIVPRRTFSPNGDGQGFECWEILNARILRNCTVYVFDSKGLIVQETSSPFGDDNCIWDGTANGKAVPEGVYYYVLRCDDSELNRTGSILLAR